MSIVPSTERSSSSVASRRGKKYRSVVSTELSADFFYRPLINLGLEIAPGRS